MGLGLAVSFGIIRRHEGSVEVDSEVGVGTRFRISLPKARVAGNAIQLEPETAKPIVEMANTGATVSRKGYQPKILVVDDEEAVRELLRDLVEAGGCRAYLAPGGREALNLFAAQQFDGVFTDSRHAGTERLGTCSRHSSTQ